MVKKNTSAAVAEETDLVDPHYIAIKGARTNNLRNVDLKIPKNKLVVVTGVSGSGKSSITMDTLYAEGQRRYVESLSSYARQFLGRMKKPDVDYIRGICPAIAIEQRVTTGNARSTVGSMTEVYDFLRLLYNSRCIVGNSSVGIRECSFLGVPAVNIGTRQQGRDRGRNVIDVAHDRAEIGAAMAQHFSNGRYGRDPLYGNGNAGVRIADVLATAVAQPPRILTHLGHVVYQVGQCHQVAGGGDLNRCGTVRKALAERTVTV